MPTVSWADNQILHSNYAFVVYDGNIIGRLDSVKFIIEKDVEYDRIIGSGGKPFGHPIIKSTKFYGSFKKAMFRISEADKILMLDSVGNAHADARTEHDPSNFRSDIEGGTKYIDEPFKSLTVFPATLSSFAMSFGGVVIKRSEIDVINNKWITFSGELIGSFVEYNNTLTQKEVNDVTKGDATRGIVDGR